jgi:TetR/AcrR family transcriptional regulator, transcriptional repressor for nem operon
MDRSIQNCQEEADVSRPREFATDTVLDAVKDAFWRKGFEATSLADLEDCTGLSRSSLYQAFGSKRGLFEAALARYREQDLDPVLTDLERPGAGLAELRQYFTMLSDVLRADPELAARGCLVVNTMTELAARDEAARLAAVAYNQRVTAALANGLRGAATGAEQRGDADRRARVMCAAVIGALVTAHFDPKAAAALCQQLSADLTEVPPRACSQA